MVLEENGKDKMVREIDCIEEKTLLNNILRRKANWISHILRINCLLHDAIEGQMMDERSRKKKNTAPG